MRGLFAAAAVAGMLALGGCAEVAKVETSVCAELAKMPPVVVASLNAIDQHSALGVYWADAKSACTNGAPTVGVSTGWGSAMLGAVKALAPVVIPALIGLL